MSPTILITRPDPAGERFADELRERIGRDAEIVISPLMRIEQTGTLPDLGKFRTLIFTSRNGVSAYAGKTAQRNLHCYCVGEATAETARSYGIEATAAAGTASDLVRLLLKDNVQGPCLHIRGEHVAGDVAGQLNAAGIQTAQAILYRQVTQSLTQQAIGLLQGKDSVILPLFSPRSARIFFSAAQIRAPLTGVALSENVADALPKGVSKAFSVAERPDSEAMLVAIERLARSG